MSSLLHGSVVSKGMTMTFFQHEAHRQEGGLGRTNGFVTCCLGVVQTQSSGLGLESGGWSLDGLGFSEQVAVLTLLLCLVFNYGWWPRHET